MTLEEMTYSILQNEGGLSDNPDDSGGITNYGISLAFAEDHPDFFDLDGDGVVTANDIRELTTDRAMQAYVMYFYQPARLDQIPDIAFVRLQIFDLAVNTGVNSFTGESEAIKVLQHAVGTYVDGLLGPMTLKAIQDMQATVGAAVLNNKIVDARLHFYDEVVAAHPEDQEFLNDWRQRANKYRVA